MKQLNDQYFTYRQTPVDYDGVARPSIKGNTLVWNQRAPLLSSNKWQANKCTKSTSGDVLTITGTTSSSASMGVYLALANTPILSGHKYLTQVTVTASFDCDVRFSPDNISMYVTGGNANVKKTLSWVFTATEKIAVVLYVAKRSGNLSSGETAVIENAMIFDLTQMGLDTITADQFKSLFPLHYYAYNSGSLLNFNGTGIKTVGKNLCPMLESTTYHGVTYTVQSDGTIIANGTASGDSKIAVSLVNLPSGNYYFSGCADDGSASKWNVYIWDVGAVARAKQWDRTTNVTNNTNSTTRNQVYIDSGKEYYFQLRVMNGQTANNIVFKPMLTVDTAEFSYEPYTTSTTSLPISTYFPTGMKSAGSGANTKYDEITGGKAITRIGTRAYASGDESDSTVTTDGTNTNYELATYTEQDVDPIYYNFYGNGTEQLLPVNTDTPSTSPLLADIIYYTVTDSEVPYRVFWAINSKGDRWDFTEREFKSFMNNPQGLGFSKTISVNRYGNAQSLTDITDNFPQPNGEVLFYDSSNSTRYDKYNQFVKFLSYEPITLYYKIPVSFYSRIPNTYSLECVVGTLTKTESKTDNMMNCSITYNALSFYKGEEVEISGTGTSYTINNDSDFPIGFEIQIDGTSMVNPYIQLSQNGNLYGEAKFIGKMNGTNPNVPFSKVYVNSKDGEQNVILEQGGSVLPNPMSYQDLSISNGSIYVTFVKLARGESTLTLGKDSGTFSAVTIRYTPIYRSV